MQKCVRLGDSFYVKPNLNMLNCIENKGPLDL